MTDTLRFLDGRVQIHIGDCLAVLAAMEPDSVDCAVTSPPYWGLRDYGVEGQIGLEPTLAEHLEVMVAVFEAVRRVLKPTGTLWLNYGDCYATAPNGRGSARSGRSENLGNTGSDGVRRNFAGKGYLKPKDLCMIPNRLAIALQDAGWWVRSEIIWGKSNPMPDSSGVYRPATAHEKIFLLTKSANADVWVARDTGEVSFSPDLSETCPLATDAMRSAARWSRMGSYYDAQSLRVDRAGDEDAMSFRGGSYVDGTASKRKVTGNKRIAVPTGWDMEPGFHGTRNKRGRGNGKAIGLTPRHQEHINHTGLHELGRGTGRLLRNYEPAQLTVWQMATRAFKEGHFATFPPELAERCIIAGCPRGGVVLDPFGGAGTTALVALRHGRLAELIELNPEYAAIARRRIQKDWRIVEALPDYAEEPLALFGGST